MGASKLMTGFAGAVLVGLRVASFNVDDALDADRHIPFKRGSGVTMPVEDGGSGGEPVNVADALNDRRREDLNDPFSQDSGPA